MHKQRKESPNKFESSTTPVGIYYDIAPVAMCATMGKRLFELKAGVRHDRRTDGESFKVGKSSGGCAKRGGGANGKEDNNAY